MEDAETPVLPTPAKQALDGDSGEGRSRRSQGVTEVVTSVFEVDIDALLPISASHLPTVSDARARLPVFLWITPLRSQPFWVARLPFAPPEKGAAHIPDIRPQVRDRDFAASRQRSARGTSVALVAVVLLGAVAWGWIGGPASYRILELLGLNLSNNPAVNAVVERIIAAESGGDANAKNKRSSATGAGQFLNQTWLELVRRHRPDLAKGTEQETLELRRDPRLAREITTRFAERNAQMLSRRCLPVTPGTLYLSHFAGGSGAIALLLAPESDDAATVMAKADKTGRTTREKIVKANPFLEKFTVADIRRWADRKMGNPGMRIVSLPSAKPALAFSGEPSSLSPGAEAIRCVQLGS